MDSQTFIRELKLFSKENKKTILFSTLIFFILSVILQIGVPILTNNNSETTKNNSNAAIPTAFEVYIENNRTGEPYTNSYILEEFFEKDQWVKWVEDRSGIEIASIIEGFRDEYPEVINGDVLKPISSNRDKSSHVFTVRFNFGDEEKNLAISKAYYELLMSEQLGFLENKNIYTISEPASIQEESDISVSSLPENSSNLFSIKNIIIIIGTSFFGGILLGFIIVVAKYLVSKEIYYGFSYSWNEEDLFISLPSGDSYKNISQAILQPSSRMKVVLNELNNNEIEKQLKQEIDYIELNNKPKIYFDSDVSNINYELKVDEFIIIVKRKETTKKWYNKQRELLKNYPASFIKIVQI